MRCVNAVASVIPNHLPSQDKFYAFYNYLDIAENLFSFTAAIPWVGSLFANFKVVSGGVLAAIGGGMLAMAAIYDLHPLSKKDLTIRDCLIYNGNHFIIQGIGNVLAGGCERNLLLGTALWVTRVALRSVKQDSDGMTGWDFILQKRLFKIIKIPQPSVISFTPDEIAKQQEAYATATSASALKKPRLHHTTSFR